MIFLIPAHPPIFGIGGSAPYDPRGPPHGAAPTGKNEPNGAPTKAQRSGFCGERTSSGMSESRRLRRDEGYVTYEDEARRVVAPYALVFGPLARGALRCAQRTSRAVGADIIPPRAATWGGPYMMRWTLHTVGQGQSPCRPQYRRSRISTMSPIRPSLQWHRMRAPHWRTSGAQLAGAKGMADSASMEMSF